MLGIPLADIDRTIRLSVAGLPVTQYRDIEGKEYDIVLRSVFTDQLSLEVFNKLHVTSVSGNIIPLNQVDSVEFKAGPTH